MDECTSVVNTGLRGVEVATTKICRVDGKAGKLVYRGYTIEDLAENATFEETAFLLLHERLPLKDEIASFSENLKLKREIPDSLITFLKAVPHDTEPMNLLQAACPILALNDPDCGKEGIEPTLKSAENLISGLAVVTALFERIRSGKEIILPENSLGHAENFLYMMTGKPPDSETAGILDTCLVLHAEHSFNASTFTARQVASTGAEIYAAVSAAVGSLSGPLHGGANVRVMEMLKEIGTQERIDEYIKKTLDAGERIMGLGHAVYKTLDPRARILAPMSRRMGELAEDLSWYELSEQLADKAQQAFKAKKGTDIYPNVDFYSASLLNAMNIPLDLFTPVFAISRIAGWTAHVIEEQYATAADKPALYRPGASYIGDYCGPDECTFIDINSR
ncbi:MAG: citrate/2-methylcitrate synthase [Desulfobacteraceae bacterium]